MNAKKRDTFFNKAEAVKTVKKIPLIFENQGSLIGPKTKEGLIKGSQFYHCSLIQCYFYLKDTTLQLGPCQHSDLITVPSIFISIRALRCFMRADRAGRKVLWSAASATSLSICRSPEGERNDATWRNCPLIVKNIRISTSSETVGPSRCSSSLHLLSSHGVAPLGSSLNSVGSRRHSSQSWFSTIPQTRSIHIQSNTCDYSYKLWPTIMQQCTNQGPCALGCWPQLTLWWL